MLVLTLLICGLNSRWYFSKPKVIWELHPEEAEVVRKTFSRHLQGDGVRETARRLTQVGYVDRKGKPFAYNTILEWFRNPYRYAGYRCWNVHDNNMKRNPKTIMAPISGAFFVPIFLQLWYYICYSNPQMRRQIVLSIDSRAVEMSDLQKKTRQKKSA